MTDEWEPLARELLQAELERYGELVGLAFRDAATRVDRGEDLDDMDLGRLRTRLEQAEIFLDIAEQHGGGSNNAD